STGSKPVDGSPEPGWNEPGRAAVASTNSRRPAARSWPRSAWDGCDLSRPSAASLESRMHDWLQIVRERLAQSGFEGQTEWEIAAELAYHAERRHSELIGTGLSESAARAAVIAEIEGREWIEIMRRSRRTRPPAPTPVEPKQRGGFMMGLSYDTKMALRSI